MTPLQRAVEALTDLPLGYDTQPITLGGKLERDELVSVVRAVLTAIREPSAAALASVEREAQTYQADQLSPAYAWMHMIDVLLKEEVTT